MDLSVLGRCVTVAGAGFKFGIQGGLHGLLGVPFLELDLESHTPPCDVRLLDVFQDAEDLWLDLVEHGRAIRIPHAGKMAHLVAGEGLLESFGLLRDGSIHSSQSLAHISYLGIEWGGIREHITKETRKIFLVAKMLLEIVVVKLDSVIVGNLPPRKESSSSPDVL